MLRIMMISLVSLAVAGVAMVVSVMTYLFERTRRQVTPSWQPKISRDKGAVSERYQSVRDVGEIYCVGEGTMEGAVLDIKHGTLVEGGQFPRSFTFRDEPVTFRFVANREAVKSGEEPVVALYWWQPGLFKRQFTAVRLHTISLRYEKRRRPILRPWTHRWVKAGKSPMKLAPMTEEHSAKSIWW